MLNASGIGYMLGGLLLGIALFRAGVVARWAAALLAVEPMDVPGTVEELKAELDDARPLAR